MQPNPSLPRVEQLEVFQAILEGIDDAVFVKDTSGRYIIGNASAAKFLGKSVQEISAKTDLDLFARDKALAIAERDRLALNRGMPLTFEDTIVIDGGPRTFVTTVGPWCDRNGRVLGTFTRAREITDQRQMEKWLMETERRFRAMIEKTSDCIALLDVNGQVLYSSPSIGRVLGYSPEEFAGQNLLSLVHPDDAQRISETFFNLIKIRNATLTSEFRCRTSAGTWKWLEGITANLLEEPAVQAVVANYRDISDRKRAEETRGLMVSIVESSHDAIISKTLDGTILTWNGGAERTYGYTAQEAIGQRVSIIVPEDRLEESESVLERVRRGQEVQEETERIRKDGQLIYVSLTSSPIRNSEGQIIGAAAISHDITFEKQRAEQIHRSQKMDAVMRVANAVSHDFNNALTIILGYCDLMGRSHYPASNLPRDLERIQRTAERAADLSRQLLAFGGKRTAVPVVLDLNVQIMKIEGMLPKLLHENIKLVLRLTRHPAFIKADPQLVDQLLVNLAVNALEAMPERGHLSIETANIDVHELKATRSGFIRPGSYVCLTVKDTGRGMTPDIMTHLYEPFFSTKPRNDHLGLGLAIAYGVVTQSGGHIDAHSEPGRGTTFDIYLPRYDSSHRPETIQKSIRSTGSETIMVVEDDPILREVAAEYLTSLGYFVLEAQDCAHALQLCREHSSSVDLLVTDIVMPDMNGPTLAEHVREISPKVKVLFMSGHPNIDLPNSSFRGTNLNFLAKPFNAAELGAKVRTVLDADF